MEASQLSAFVDIFQGDDDITQYWLVDTSQTLAVDQDHLSD